MNIGPDLDQQDSERLREFCRATTLEVKSSGGVGAATCLDMIGYMRELEAEITALKSAAGAGLRWSGEMPTEEGWWWYRNPETSQDSLIELHRDKHGVLRTWQGVAVGISVGQWAGPIPQPEGD